MKNLSSLVLLVVAWMVCACGGVHESSAVGEASELTSTDEAELTTTDEAAELTGTGDFNSSGCAPLCVQTPTGPVCSPGGPVCCSVFDQCSVLTEAACQEFCVQQGLPARRSYGCRATTAVCSCCTG
jgi:hypothetical protein